MRCTTPWRSTQMSSDVTCVVTVYSFRLRGLPGRAEHEIVIGHRVISLRKLKALLREHPAQAGLGAAKHETEMTEVTISFLDIGQRQVITAPAQSSPEFGLG
jgi:hypothetical protein